MLLPTATTILDALGQSFVWEEGLGNYQLARQLAEKHFQTKNEPIEKAKAALILGIVNLLRGNIKRATIYWDQASTDANHDNSLELLLAAFRHLTTYERWNTKLDGSATASIEVLARWDTAHEMQVVIPELDTLRKNCTDRDAQNLAWYLSEIVGVGKNARSVAERWHSMPYSEEQIAVFRKMVDNMEQTASIASKQRLTHYSIFAHWLRADVLHRAQFNEQAMQALELAEDEAKTHKDEARQALCLLLRGDWLAASFSTVMAWDFALVDSMAEHSTLASVIETKEFPPLEKKDLKAARVYYQQAAKKFAGVGAKRGLAKTQLRLGYLFIRLDQWKKAMTPLLKAEDLFRECEDYRGVMMARTYQLLSQLWLQEWEGLHQQAAIIGRWGNYAGDFSFIQSLGFLINRFTRHLFLRHGRFEAARMGYQIAQSLFTALDAPINANQNLVDQALLNEAVGDFISASPEIKLAANRFMHLAQVPPSLWTQLQEVQPVMLQYAIMLATRGYNISINRTDPEQLTQFQQQLVAFVKLLNPTGVVPTAQPTTTEEFRIFSLTQLATGLNNQAKVLIPYYKFKKADRDNQQVLAKQYWDEAYGNLGQLGTAQSLFYETILWGAIQNYPRAIAIFKKTSAMQMKQLPALSTEKSKSGIGMHDDDLVLTKHYHFWEQRFKMWVNLKAYTEAEKAWHKRCALENENWWKKETAPWQIGSSIAEMFEGLEAYEKASSYCQQSLDILDLHRDHLSRDELKTAIANDRGVQFLYHQGARLATRREAPEEAFAYIEQGKARALLDLLSAQPDHLVLKTQERSLVQKWRASNAKLQAFRGLLAVESRGQTGDEIRTKQLENEIAKELLHLKALEAKLVQSMPAFFSTVGGSGEILGISDLQQYLEKGQLFIGFSYLENDLFIWAINKDGLVNFSWQEQAQKVLSNLAKELHEACQHKYPYQEISEKLAEILLLPIVEFLDEYNQLYLAPSRSLYLVPFHILPIHGKPLGASHLISFIPSASALQYFRQVDIASSCKVLVIGNPNGDLPSATIEANFVAQLFQADALLGKAATEKAVRLALPKNNILHLATHAYLSEDAPLSSALALANEEQLSLYELMGIQLQAELVVLSACETGKGIATNGDDVLGLTRGLLAAGAKAAIVSFWPVDDASTALFMQYFYQHLKQHRSPAEALTFAQKKLRKASKEQIHLQLKKELDGLSQERKRSIRGIKLYDNEEREDGYSHPFYWAPFFYVGKL